jgi:hypothetical protein
VAAPPAAPASPADVIARLKLQMLVYADAPADRLVFINNQKYVEGEILDGQVVLEAITPEAAIVSYQGRRYTLRQ